MVYDLRAIWHQFVWKLYKTSHPITNPCAEIDIDWARHWLSKYQSPLYKECTECEPGDIYWRINELKTMQIIMVKTWVSMVKNVSNINMNVIILLDNLIEGKRLSYYGHFYCRNVLTFLKWHFLNIIWRFIKAKSRFFLTFLLLS